MKYCRVILFLWVLSCSMVFAQQGAEELMGIIYNKETAFDLRFHNNGPISLGVNLGKIKTYYKTTFYRFELDEIHHPKEVKQSVDVSFLSGESNSFTYGKQNNFIVLRTGYGQKKYLTEKAAKNGVAIATVIEGGLSLGLQKPYYLTVVAGKEFAERSIRYSDATAKEFLDLNKIVRSDSYFNGFGDITPVIGAHFQAGLHIDWGAFDEVLKALEVGVMVDIFPKKIPIMVSQENSAYFMNFYVSLQLGKRR
jgi:hypothetical protein